MCSGRRCWGGSIFASGTIIVAFRPHVVCSAVIVTGDRCRRRGTFSDSGRGWEQGDILMPLLFSIEIQGALEEAVALNNCARSWTMCSLVRPFKSEGVA